VLRRHGLNTRARRLGLIAGYAAPPEREPRPAPPRRHLEVSQPGELVQMDCFCVGRLQGTKGAVWQHRHRRRLRLLLGRTARRFGQASRVALDLRARPTRRHRPRSPRLVPRSRHERSRHRVRRPVLRDHRRAQRRAPTHRGGSSPDQRLCRTRPRDHPRGMLEAVSLLRHPEIRAALGEAARARAHEFSTSRAAKVYAQHLGELHDGTDTR
jgi:hypothetical protein